MMKKAVLYIFTLTAALLMAACEKDSIYGQGEGGVVVQLAGVATRAVSTAGATIDDCTVYIYEQGAGGEQTLVRKYLPGDCPSTIKLLAGSYTARVQWGEAPAAAAFDKCLYEGSEPFTVAAGKTTPLAVHCYPQSAVVQVLFELPDEVTDPSVSVSLEGADGPGSSLLFEKEDTGYFTVPETGASLQIEFHATHAVKGTLFKSETLKNIEGGKKYTLRFKYSPDLPGYIEIEKISVDLSEDIHDDNFVFNKQPEVRGDIFSGKPEFGNEAMTLTLAVAGTDARVRRGDIYLMGTEPLARAASDPGERIFRWTSSDADEGERDHVSWKLENDGRELNLTLNPAFFRFPMGETKLYFEVEDTNDNTGSNQATIVINWGIRPVNASDYDLWTNTFTARAVSTGAAPTFKLRKAGTTAWRELAGTPAGGSGEYTATFTPEWDSSYNDQAQANVYRPKPEQSVFANNTYEVAVDIDGQEYLTSFYTACDQPIPDSDMANSSLTCFSMSHGSFWDSGNLSILGGTVTAWLCVQDEKTDASGKTWKCAHLQAGEKAGLLSAGNLFTGSFAATSLTAGTVSFGMDYDWQARPTALHVKCCAEIGKANSFKHEQAGGGFPLTEADQDISVLYVAIVDWDEPHKVTSGTNYPTGMWSPAETTDPGEGAVIGYGILKMSQSTGTTLEDMVIPISYYDRVAKPSKNLKVVISSSTSYYGDYMVGCKDNNMWLTDFSWVY